MLLTLFLSNLNSAGSFSVQISKTVIRNILLNALPCVKFHLFLIRVIRQSTKKDRVLLVMYRCDKLYPDTEIITLVMDNLALHSAAALYETSEPEEAKRIWIRPEFIYTPEHGNWLNMAEIELNVLIKQCLNR